MLATRRPRHILSSPSTVALLLPQTSGQHPDGNNAGLGKKKSTVICMIQITLTAGLYSSRPAGAFRACDLAV
uniref:Uncharacterized protein n=1 Tax=Leersia perrieri TaxID=77586 RepID=A0A0D9X0G0_9ORYZ